MPLGQQRRCVIVAANVEAARDTPGPACRIVQLRARGPAGVARSCCDQDLAVRQQGRGVKITCIVETARGSPGSAGRIVQFGARKDADITLPPRDKDLAVSQQGRRVWFCRPPLRLPVVVQVPLAGSYSSALAPFPPATRTMPLDSNVAVW